MATNNRWAARKGGSFVARDALSLEQQQILAAVPRWKKEWVRPTNLQPGQNPNYKILKWVVDTSADKSSGTVEEMEAAVEQVTAGNNVEESGLRTTGEAGNTALPGLNGSTPAPPPPASAPTTQVATATLESSSNPIKEVMQPGSAQEGGATTVTGGQGQGIVHEAVKPLEGVPSQGLVDGGGQTEQKDKSLMEE